MEKDNAIEKLVKLSKMFTTFVNITKKIIINKDMILHSVNQVKDYTVSFSLGSSKLLDKSEIELQEIIKDITENIHSISDSYFEFIMQEIGHDNPDYNGYLREGSNFVDSIDHTIEILDYQKSSYDEKEYQDLQQLKSFISNIDSYAERFMNKISSLKIFNNISRIQGNTVLIGANGSGKSTFARQLKRLHNDSVSIISAQHLLYYQKSDNITYTEEPYNTIRDFQRADKLPMYQGFYDFQRQATEDFKNLVTALINEYTQVATEYYESDDKKKSVLVDVINIWNSIVEHRKLIVDKLSINVQDLGSGEVYEFNRMSDGEKAIFYYIAHVLIALPSNYIVVDEPENHINLALCNLLWDKMEKVRQDCTFVYLTHNVDFAVSRINAQIFWNKSFTMPDSWEIIPIPQHTGIPDELLVEIAGSRKDVLFCEGDKGSWDYKLYSQLFEDKYTVLPVRGHLDVINYCNAYNNANLFHGHAVGIIDRDFHSDAQITSWGRHNIHVLPFSEIENLMCTDPVFDHFKNISLITAEQIEEFKNAAFQDMERNIDQLVTVYVRDTLNNAFKNNMLVNKKNFENLKSEFENLINSMNIEQIREEAKNEFSKIVIEKNYDKYLEKTNVKNKLIMEFAPKYLQIGDYPNRVLMQIQSNTELLERIRQEYFLGI
ncbi:DUF4435 domain-containing protein [Enterococcus faecium]